MQTRKRLFMAGLVAFSALLAAPGGVMAQGAAVSASQGGSAALLAAIPEDATAFLALRNLKETDADVQAISTQIGFPLGPEGMFPGPLDWLKMELGIGEGLNEAGGVAFVVLNCSEVQTLDELPTKLMLIVAATDPKALIQSFGGEEGEEGVYQVSLGGTPSVAMPAEGFVLLAQTSDTLKAAAKTRAGGVARTMSPDRVKAFQQQDLFVWLNLRGISEPIRTQIGEGLTGLMAMANPMGGPDQATDLVKQLDQFFKEGQELSGGLAIDPKKGLIFSGSVRVREGTDLAKIWMAQEPVKGSLLTGLPDEPAVFVMGGAGNMTPEAQKQAREAMERLAKQISQLDQDEGSPLTPEGLKPLIDNYINLVGGIEQVSLGVSGLPAAGEDGLIALTVVAKVKDAGAFRNELREAFASVKEIAIGVAKADQVDEETIKQVSDAFEWQADAATVGPASVDQIILHLDKLPDVQEEDLAQVRSIIGTEGLLIRVGAVGDKYVVITLGGGEKRFGEIAALVEKGEAPMSKNQDIAKVADRLPKGDRTAEAYFNLDHLLEVVMAVATQLEMPLPVPLAMRNAAPIALTQTKIDASAVQLDMLVPIELVVSTTQMVQQIIPMMLGGGGIEMDENDAAIEEVPANEDQK